MKHTWKGCTNPHCYGCTFCDGGLEWCSVCGSFEGATTTHCPGAQMDSFTSDKVYTTDLDFVDGTWRRNPNSFAGQMWWGRGTPAEVGAEVDRVEALPSMERHKITRGWPTP